MTRADPVPENPVPANTVKCVVWDIDNTLLTGTYLESGDQPPGADPAPVSYTHLTLPTTPYV